MNKKYKYSILLFFLWAQVVASLAKKPSDSPNILFVFSDDHAWQSIGAYGGRLKEVAHTPISTSWRVKECFSGNVS